MSRLFVRVLLFLLVSLSAMMAQNLVTNGGFETGDFNGWTQLGDTSYTGVCPSGSPSENCSGRDVFEGQWIGSFGAIHSPGGVTQSIATTPGQAYTISYWLQTGYQGFPDSIEVNFGGVTLFAAVNMDHIFWTRYTFTETATTSSTDLTFLFYSIPDYFDLDDVSVEGVPVETPEPASMFLLGSSVLGLAMLRCRAL